VRGSSRSDEAAPRAPLAGKRVAVTRPAEQAASLSAELEARGAYVISCPTIRLAEPESWAPLDRALARLEEYDWVVFTSANGARFTLRRMAELGSDVAVLRTRSVGAVGPGTAAALAERAIPVTFVARAEGSIPLAESLAPVRGRSIAMIRSDRADPVAAGVLERRGARNVDDVVAYRTVPASPGEAALLELRDGIDGLTFTSPSTVRGFLDGGPEWRRWAESSIVATLGPTTTAAAREEGLVVHEASEKTMVALVDALEHGLARRAAEERDAHGRAR